jgi:hypothetical protein
VTHKEAPVFQTVSTKLWTQDTDILHYPGPKRALRLLRHELEGRRKTCTTNNKILSGNKPCQFWTGAQRSADLLRHHQGNNVMGDRCVTFIISLMMEAAKVSETLGSCPELTRLVARENFIDFCHRENFQVIYVLHRG